MLLLAGVITSIEPALAKGVPRTLHQMPQHGPWLDSPSFLVRQAWVPLCLGSGSDFSGGDGKPTAHCVYTFCGVPDLYGLLYYEQQLHICGTICAQQSHSCQHILSSDMYDAYIIYTNYITYSGA